jgi:hypothetical protein
MVYTNTRPHSALRSGLIARRIPDHLDGAIHGLMHQSSQYRRSLRKVRDDFLEYESCFLSSMKLDKSVCTLRGSCIVKTCFRGPSSPWLTMRTVGPLALNDRLRALSRAAASLQPGPAERLGLRPEFALNRDAQVSGQNEGNSEDLCINCRFPPARE